MNQLVNLFRLAGRKSNRTRKNRSLTQRRLGSETLEKRQLLAGDVLVAHNYLIAEDVNSDYKVSPLDALAVINQIAKNGGSQNLAGMSRGDLSKYYDVSGDNKVTPLDALRVINNISRGEGLGANNEVVELRLTPLTTGDTEFTDPNKFDPATRDLKVAVGEVFNLEVGYKDLRETPTGDLGVFQFVADIVAASAGKVEPVLTETQTLAISSNVFDGVSGDVVFSRTGVTETPFKVPVATFVAGDVAAISSAVSSLYGLTASQFTVVSVGAGANNTVEYDIRFTDYTSAKLADKDLADLKVDGALLDFGNGALAVTSTNNSIEPRLPGGAINPAAIAPNINFKSRTFGNNLVFFGVDGVFYGGYDPAVGVTGAGGVGFLVGGGVPDAGPKERIKEPFDAFSLPFVATAPTTSKVEVRASASTSNDFLIYTPVPSEARLVQPLDNLASSTTVFLDTTSGFRPLTGETSFLIKIDNEQMLVTAVNSTLKTLTVVRGQNNTTIASHVVPPVTTPPTNNVETFQDDKLTSAQIFVDLGANPAIATDGFGFVNVVATTSNTAPTISDIADRSVNQGTSTGAIAFTVGDTETAVASLTVSGSSSNTTLVPNANIVFSGSGANRTVTITPAAGQVGNATITVTVSDGTLTATDTFVLTVNNGNVNTAPTISNITDRSVTTGVSTGAIAFTVADTETPVANLTVSASSSNTTLVPTGSIVFGGSGANRTVTVTPAAGQTGNATITVTVSDGALTATDTFVLTVTSAANTAPTISNIADRSTTTGISTGAVAFTVGDAQTAAASLTVTGTSSNTTLVPNANIVFGGTGANRTVTVTPAAGQTGNATITVTVSDGALTATDTFVLTVTSAANTAPTISNIADRSTTTGISTGAVAFTVGDAQTAAASLTVTGTSSNTTLVPNANIVFGGSGANRTVTVTPAAGQVGNATITVTVSDGTLTATDTFVLTVNPVANTAPTISNIVDRSITIGTSTGAVAFTVGDSQTAAANLTVTGTSSNTALVPNANIVFGGSGANRTVTVTPVAGQTGNATITVTVSDGSLTASDTFVLTVTPASNTAPTISNIANVTINEDAGTGAVAFTVGDSQTAVGSLVVSGTSSNTTLVPNANIVFGGSGASRTVTVTPVANRSGSATITLTVSDGSLSTSDTFVLTVNSVNDAPAGVSATRTLANGAAYTFSASDFPITDASDSPANALAGIVIGTLPNAAQGTLRLAGAAVTTGQFVTVAQLPTLTFNSVAGVLGNKLGGFTFQVRDNGGTANGGIDTDPTAGTFDFNLINFVPSTISGKIFTDFLESLANPIRDGQQDPLEPAMGGLPVRLSIAGSPDVVRATDGNGNYAFTDLAPGTYTIKFEVPDTIIPGSRVTGSTPTTTLSSTSFQVVIPAAGGLNATGNNFTVLGTQGTAADTLDILVSHNRRNIGGGVNRLASPSFAVLNAQGDQQFFQLGDGFTEVVYAELSVNDNRDAALLTVLNEDGSVESSLLSGDNLAVDSDGNIVGLFGGVSDLKPVTDNAAALADEFGDYRDAIDAIIASGSV